MLRPRQPGSDRRCPAVADSTRAALTRRKSVQRRHQSSKRERKTTTLPATIPSGNAIYLEWPLLQIEFLVQRVSRSNVLIQFYSQPGLIGHRNEPGFNYVLTSFCQFLPYRDIVPVKF